MIAHAECLETQDQAAAVSLLFAAGQRPCAGDVRALASRSEAFTLSIDPTRDSDAGEGWLELLANGLTFELTGLAPTGASEMPLCQHSFGLSEDIKDLELEAITLAPGPHLAGGASMVPVARAIAHLAACLTELGDTKAVAWHAAGMLSEPDFFHSGVLGWIAGGAFPGLGLTALVTSPDGSLKSEGLALFTGQELLVPADASEDTSDAAKIALRLINWLVGHGRIDREFRFIGPSGELIRLEPVQQGRIVLVWRGIG